ncbi:hypothetical protein P3H15_54045, partial [Rhodococcus sp. T2V]|uniref:hypothetical protein n=1 Tax=Rhodococcus sp. T2V TaxID=3034164 RepID=UPI0023E307D7
QVRVPPAVETAVVAANIEREMELNPGPCGISALGTQGSGAPSSRAALAQSCSSGDAVVVAVHADEEQLLAAHPTQKRFGDCGFPGGFGVGERPFLPVGPPRARRMRRQRADPRARGRPGE